MAGASPGRKKEGCQIAGIEYKAKIKCPQENREKNELFKKVTGAGDDSLIGLEQKPVTV